MKEQKFTPAPWYAVNYGGYIKIQSTDFYENTDILDEDKCPQAELNAILATCAPELLEALQESILCLDKYCIPETSDELKELVSKSKSIIRKALGE